MEKLSRELYLKAIQRWGKPSQIEMLLEEMAELSMAIQKFKRDPSKDRAKDIEDEMADVEIMLEQCKLIFSETSIIERKKFKLDRLNTTLMDTMFEKYTMDPKDTEGFSD